MREEWVSLGNGLRLHLLVWEPPMASDAGARPFLFVHGLASNARLWTGVADHLHAAGHPSVAVDLRGHGRSAKPEFGYDTATAAEDLGGLIGALGLDRPVVVGQSWGGNVALELAARLPQLVGGVACVDGGWIEPSARFPTWDECVEHLAPPQLNGTPAAQIEARLRTMHPSWNGGAIAATMANFEIHDDASVSPWLTRDRHLQILRDLWERRPESRYPDVAAPVLLLPVNAGARDLVATAERLLPRARTVWFVGDHDLHAERPGDVADELLAACREGFFP